MEAAGAAKPEAEGSAAPAAKKKSKKAAAKRSSKASPMTSPTSSKEPTPDKLGKDSPAQDSHAPTDEPNPDLSAPAGEAAPDDDGALANNAAAEGGAPPPEPTKETAEEPPSGQAGRASKISKRSTGGRVDLAKLGDGGAILPPVIKATAFERFMVKYPCLSFWLWFAFAMLWVMIAGALIRSEKVVFDQTGVWNVRTSQLQGQIDAFRQAQAQLSSQPVNESEVPEYEERSVRYFGDIDVFLFSEDGKEDLLSAQNLAFLQSVERRVMQFKGMGDFCGLQWGAAAARPQGHIIAAVSGGVLSLDAPMANGSTALFRADEEVGLDPGAGLKDLERYLVVEAGGGNSVRLFTIVPSGRGEAVEIGSAGGVVGGRLFELEAKCQKSTSLASFSFPNAEAHRDAACAGFWKRTQLCGCPEGTPLTAGVNDTTCSAGYDCRGRFGESECMAYVPVEPAPVGEGDPKIWLKNLCHESVELSPVAERLWKDSRRQMLPSDWSCVGGVPGPATDVVRGSIRLAGPLKGFTKLQGESGKAQSTLLNEWTNNGLLQEMADLQKEVNGEREGVKVVIGSGFAVSAMFSAILASDGMFAFGSILFVWAWCWCSTGSLLLATMCIFETIVSLPMAMALWGIVGQKYIGFLCTMMLFVILGIGADDVFVLFDAWKQSGLMGFGEDTMARFAWTYRTAGKAMLVTTITTCFCFAAAGFSSIPSVSGFGWFAAMVVMFDYLLVMTLYAAAILVYHFHFERKNTLFSCGGGKASGAGELRAEPEDLEAAPAQGRCCTGHMGCCPNRFTEIDKKRPLWKQPKLIAPPAFLFLVGFALCFTPFAFPGAMLICASIIYPHGVLTGQADSESARPIETFFEKTFFPFVQKHSLKILVPMSGIVLALLIVAIVGLKLPEENDKFLRDDHPAQVYLDAVGKFASGFGYDGRRAAYIVYGINREEPFDRSGVDFQEPGATFSDPDAGGTLGNVIYSDQAINDMTSKAGREGIIATCDAARVPEITELDTGCEQVVLNGVSFPRLLSAAALSALEDSGDLQKVEGPGTKPRYVAKGGMSLSDIGTGFCSLGVECFMYDVRDYLEHYCGTATATSARLLFGKELCSLEGKDVGGAGSFASEGFDLGAVLASKGYRLYLAVAAMARSREGHAYSGYSRNRGSFVVTEPDAARPSLAWVGLNASMPAGRRLPYPEQVKLQDRLLAFMERNRAGNPNAFLIMDSFAWTLTASALRASAFESVAIALVFSWVVLLATTRNLAVGTIALITVGSIVAGAFGLMVIIGWSLGIIEAIACIVVIGVSVDYSVHIAHAYQEAEVEASPVEQELGVQPSAKREREERVRIALGSIGISLVSGVMTSLGATMFLFFCNVNFFSKFGILLFMTLATSFVFAFLLLVPLLLNVGPAGGRCSLRLPNMHKKAKDGTE